MKLTFIESYLLQTHVRSPLTNPESPNNFDQYLQGKSYYQNRQPIWEKSAVSFQNHSVATAAKVTIDEEKQLNQNAIKPHAVSRSVDDNQDNPPSLTRYPVKSVITHAPVESRPTQLCNTADQINEANLADAQIIRWLNRQLRHNDIIRQNQIKRLLPLSNHQLFIHDQQANLTLQAYPLNQQEIRLIVQVIRSYLSQKGIRLRQCYINGEQYDR